MPLTVANAPFCPQLLEGLEAALHGALLALLDLRARVALVEHLEVDIGEGVAHACLQQSGAAVMLLAWVCLGYEPEPQSG